MKNNSQKLSPKMIGVISALFTFLAFFIFSIVQFFASHNSMALLGTIVSIIMIGLPLTALGFGVGWAISYLRLSERRNFYSGIAVVALLVPAIGLCSLGYSYRLRETAKTATSKPKLIAISHSFFASKYSAICTEITKNPNFDMTTAVEIKKTSDCYLDMYFAPRPETPSEILIALSHEKFCPNIVIKLLRENPNLPPEASQNIEKNCPQ